LLTNIIIIIFVSAIVQFFFRRDFDKGFAAAVFFLVLLPVEVRLEVPGALPQLTEHRIILLIAAWNSLALDWKHALRPVSRIVFLLFLVALCHVCTTLTAIDSMLNLKDVLGFLIETLLYFVVIAVGLRTRRGIELMAWGSLWALLIVAIIATIEKYTGKNLAAMIVPGMADSPDTVSATFRHRILLGYAMAMAFPLALVLRETAATRWKQRLGTVGIIIFPAACYYSSSRGPWVGCALGGVTMGILGGQAIRRKLFVVVALAVAVLVVRPGVRDTILSLWHQTFTDSSIKGQSASYRKELWIVAWKELSKSPERMLLGYGGHSTETMDLGEYFDRGAGGQAAMLGYTSWDSQYASDFMQFGFVGFGLEAILYVWILITVLRTWWSSNESDRFFAAACVAVVSVFIWAMFTVAIFNPQLEFLFWSVVAISGKLHHLEDAYPAREMNVTLSTEADGEMVGSPESSRL
jgi:hypothetical protein